MVNVVCVCRLQLSTCQIIWLFELHWMSNGLLLQMQVCSYLYLQGLVALVLY